MTQSPLPVPGSPATPLPALPEALAAALDWWRDAGVDCDFLDAPRDWLPAPQPVTASDSPAPVLAMPPPPPEPDTPKFAGDPAQWPQGLAGFAPWWMAEPDLDSGLVTDRVPPRGAANAALMVIVPYPEPGDAKAGQLLSGPQGQLLSAMLGAMGLTEADIYFAAALPRAMPAADWAALGASGLGRLIAHHIALVAPQRVLAFGGHILPLLGHELPQSPAILPIGNQEGATVSPDGIPALAVHDLGVLLDRPRSKAGFWRRWLEWTA